MDMEFIFHDSCFCLAESEHVKLNTLKRPQPPDVRHGGTGAKIHRHHRRLPSLQWRGTAGPEQQCVASRRRRAASKAGARRPLAETGRAARQLAAAAGTGAARAPFPARHDRRGALQLAPARGDRRST